LIVFSPGGAEQLVDVRVADVRCVTVEREVLPVPDPGQQLEPEQVRERVHGVALALGVGVDRVRLSIGLLAEQPFDDVDGFPHSARDEM